MDKMNSPTSEDADLLGRGQDVGLYCGALLLAMYYVNSRRSVRKLPVLLELPEYSPNHSPQKLPLCPSVRTLSPFFCALFMAVCLFSIGHCGIHFMLVIWHILQP